MNILSTNELHQIIGDNLKRALSHYGLSISEASRISGVSRSCISNTINHKSHISTHTFLTLCHKLRISADFLCEPDLPIRFVDMYVFR